MKDIEAFLSSLDDMGIELRSDGDQLRCNAPRGVLTQSLRAELAERKAEILSVLHRMESGSNTIHPVSRDRDLPLSFSQRRLWFLEQMEKGSPAYNMPSALHLIGSLNLAALRRSITEIVRRHEILRTTFPVKDGSPVQSIASPSEINITTVDLRHVPESEQSSRVRLLADEEAQR
ncbi:MAG: condensation domain-containing protein, partial [Candidatus Omnitrophota bacterium]